MSDKLTANMFPAGESPLGQEISVYSSDSIDTYLIVGIYKYEQSSFMPSTVSDKDKVTDLYVPVSVTKATSSNKNYQSFTVKAQTDVNTVQLTDDITSYFKKLYANNVKWEPGAMNMESAISSLTSMLNTISIAVAVIAAISLLVGGIGVMNIMLVSVTERTREIGTRKALGARSSFIKMQFIVEAVIICVIGGMIGIVVGLALGYLGASLLGYPSAVSIPIILISVSFSMAIGVFFGYYPANKAAKLDPIEALRYE